jgi:branched-chain amino acid transport system ATP-binding protein
VTDTLIEARDLSAGYGKMPVVRDVSISVAPGEVVALLGANGAGKTTTLLTISGLIHPMRGRLTVLQRQPPRFPHTLARRGVAHVTESRNLFYDLTVSENMRLALRGSRSKRKAAMAHAFALFPGLEPLRDRRAALLSGGEQQMLACARALITEPKLLLLDEMSLGLAPIIVERLLRTVRDIADQTGAAVLLVEQHVHLALRVVDRAYVLSHGTIVHEGSSEALSQERDVLESSYLGDVAVT